jgi:hypothetical protein
MERLLNQSHNKYSQDIMYIKSYEESISYIFIFTRRNDSRVGLYMLLQKTTSCFLAFSIF